MIGIFNYSTMAVVNDLFEAGDALADRIVIRALAGDLEAQDTLAGARDGSVDVDSLDVIPPIEEPFVLDADPWQTSSIQTLLKFSDSHCHRRWPARDWEISNDCEPNCLARRARQERAVLL